MYVKSPGEFQETPRYYFPWTFDKKKKYYFFDNKVLWVCFSNLLKGNSFLFTQPLRGKSEYCIAKVGLLYGKVADAVRSSERRASALSVSTWVLLVRCGKQGPIVASSLLLNEDFPLIPSLWIYSFSSVSSAWCMEKVVDESSDGHTKVLIFLACTCCTVYFSTY